MEDSHMKKVIVIRYSEMFLKGKNRGFFERVFATNIERALRGIRHELRRYSGRYLVEGFGDGDADRIVERLKKVFGIHSMSVALETGNGMDDIVEAAIAVSRPFGSFKVETHRADKRYPLTSVEISREVGGRLLAHYKALTVDVHDPSFYIYVDVRENGTALVFGEFFAGADGMPVGTAGRGLLLISGGIDSPVAGHMMAKRGMSVECLHFHSYPYTNLQAKEKVVELARVLVRLYARKSAVYGQRDAHSGIHSREVRSRAHGDPSAAVHVPHSRTICPPHQGAVSDYGRKPGTGRQPDGGGDDIFQFRHREPARPPSARGVR